MTSKRLLKLEIKLFESLSNARKLYSDKLDPKVFEELVSIDSSKTFKYIEKICKFYIQDRNINLKELKTEIESFNTLSEKNIIDVKDINQFKSYAEFKSYILDNSDRMSKTAERELIKNDGSEVILNTKDLLVLLIKEQRASIQYGSGTRWCIAAKTNNYYSRYRNKKVTFYFIFQKNLDSTNPNYKLAVAVYNTPEFLAEVYSADDRRHDFSIVEELGLSKDLFKPVKRSKQEIFGSYINGDYTVNRKGEIDVEGDVTLPKVGSILKVGKFGKVTGNFICDRAGLTDLKGSPYYVGGFFSCANNSLLNLEFSPNEVKSDFYCFSNKLETLQGAPKHVGGDFDCRKNTTKFTEGDVLDECEVIGEIIV